MNFADAIRKYRSVHPIRNRDIYQKTKHKYPELSEGRISYLLKKQDLRLSDALKISEALGVGLDELLRYESLSLEDVLKHEPV